MTTAIIVICSIVGGLLLVWAFIWLNNSLLKTTRYEVEMPVEAPVKIVHLTDLHGKRFGAKMAGWCAKLRQSAPIL